MVQSITENKMSACMTIAFSEMDCDGFFHSLTPYGCPLDTHLLLWENLYFLKNYVDLYTQQQPWTGEFLK